MDVYAGGGMEAVTVEAIRNAAAELMRYKQGRAALEARLVEDELWYKQRHWDVIRRGNREYRDGYAPPEPSSGWLFNAIINKHADLMDNVPEAMVLPREADDEAAAKVLSEVVPALMERIGFEETYDDGCWEKVKSGSAAYCITWDNEAEGGLGEISIKCIDLLKVFWEPGVSDIQRSRNLFIVDLVDEDLLEARYPQHKGKLGGGVIDVAEYVHDDTIDTSNKVVVVDWYYKAITQEGKKVVHFVKFAGECLLYASENDPQYAATGWYQHGKYPIEIDKLFPEKDTPVGFGYVAICKDPQMYIDRLSANIMETSMMGAKRRWFASRRLGIDPHDLMDWRKSLVEVEGDFDEKSLKEFEIRPLDPIYANIMQMKVDEMKETSANRDISNGSSGGGVTAASAIAALQEAGNKVSRDMISAGYRSFGRIVTMCLELMAQFYDVERAFRIVGRDGAYKFVAMSSRELGERAIQSPSGDILYRKPAFDLKIRAMKKNPFSRMEQNERAKELYGMGFFQPDRAQEALLALEMMDFEGIDKVREKVQEGNTMYNLVQQMAQQMDQMAAIIGLDGAVPQGGGAPAPMSGQVAQTPSGGGNSLNGEIMEAQTPRSGYAQSLAQRSKPSVEG